MVEVAGLVPHCIPSTPIEIDVYRDPHTRMKELIVSVVEIIQQELLNFNHQEREGILQSVYWRMWELKTHEIIENVFIMNKLQERLRILEVYNQRVCNCHEDSSLLSILDLVEVLHSSSDTTTTNQYWHRLQTAVYAFMEEFFSHMEEEENTFQPLLCQYFEYEELKQIKETVMAQHKLWKEKVLKEKNLLDHIKDTSNEFKCMNKSSSYCDKLRELSEEKNATSLLRDTIQTLPQEMVLEVLRRLGPLDLISAGSTCRGWRELSLSPELWRVVPLARWEEGDWSWGAPQPPDPADIQLNRRIADQSEESPVRKPEFYLQFSRFSVLIGEHIRQLILGGSRGIDNLQLNTILENCLNLEKLDVSYTDIQDNGLQRLGEMNLTELDVSGCRGVTDLTLRRLSQHGVYLESLVVSGCTEITDGGVLALYSCNQRIKRADFSGCFRLTGSVLSAFISNCPSLQAEDLAYCSLIQDGPYPEDAMGCQNYSCQDYCCQSHS